MTAVLDRPRPERSVDRRAPRRAVARWSLRLFRREWRQHVLVLGLIALAVAAATVAVALVVNAPDQDAGSFGDARQILSIDPDTTMLAEDIAAGEAAFGAIDVVAHARLAAPGVVEVLDVRDQRPDAPLTAPLLALRDGRYPSAAREVAVTDGAAALLGASLGGTVEVGDREATVVGIVENPRRLSEDFVLVAPGSLAGPEAERIDMYVRATDAQLREFRWPDGAGKAVRGYSPVAASLAAALVLAVASVGLLFVGLLSVAGFAVMAQRRRRALGMLGALGATRRQVRRVMVSSGAWMGGAGALGGLGVGLVTWTVSAGLLEGPLDHRIDRFDLPWWFVPSTVALAVVTAIGAAWWPARSAARLSIVAALSGRPPSPRPAHRFAAAGFVLLAAGAALLRASDRVRGLFVEGGVVAVLLGALLLAPVAVRGLGATATRAPIAVRIAVRDLVRFRARASAAVGAVALGTGIAATIAIAAADAATHDASSGVRGNLPANELLVYTGRPGLGPVRRLDAGELDAARAAAQRVAAAVGADAAVEVLAAVPRGVPSVSIDGVSGPVPVALVRVDRQGDRSVGFAWTAAVFVATDAVLRFAGIDPAAVPAGADVVTRRRDLDGTQLLLPDPERARGGERPEASTPAFAALPGEAYTSEPTTLLTAGAVERLGLETLPVAWAVRAPAALTGPQLTEARRAAAAAGLVVESRRAGPAYARVGTIATATGLAAALAVLVMTIGMIRSETDDELRILDATGASSQTRRGIVAATAASLGLLGAVLGVLGAYVALVAWYHDDLARLAAPPWRNLALIVVALPLAGWVVGGLLGGRGGRPPRGSFSG